MRLYATGDLSSGLARYRAPTLVDTRSLFPRAPRPISVRPRDARVEMRRERDDDACATDDLVRGAESRDGVT